MSTEPATPFALRDYAVLADGQRGALIGPHGNIAWLCFPRFDSPALFASLIGGAGTYAITPAGRFVWGGYYEEGSLVWRSRWVTEGGGIIECREALEYGATDDRAVLLRRAEAVVGEGRLEVVMHPAPAFGAARVGRWRDHGDGTWTGSAGGVHLRWSTPVAARAVADGHGGRRLEATVTLAPGERADFVLELGTAPIDGPLPEPRQCWETTATTWRAAVPPLEHLPAQRDARHAVTVLRGLSAASGGMVAAVTTSLPERADQGRSYDYRYAWVRDQCFAGQAVAATGEVPDLLERLVGFVAALVTEHGPTLAPAYTVAGEPVPSESHVGLPGYPGGSDVVGNHVRDQFQLDAFGEALLLFAAAARADQLDAAGWQAVEVAVDAVEQCWQRPDAGIWELEDRWWCHSRLQCVAGLRAVCAEGAPGARAAAWSALADAMLAETSRRCLHPSGRWQRAADDPAVDAALLFPMLRGALPPDDPRNVATVAAVRQELAQDGYVYRFRPDARPLGTAEGAFALCGFAMSMAARLEGRPVESARWFERSRAACGPPGLLSEEFDVRERQLRGNLPQAFVHAIMLEAAVSQADDG